MRGYSPRGGELNKFLAVQGHAGGCVKVLLAAIVALLREACAQCRSRSIKVVATVVDAVACEALQQLVTQRSDRPFCSNHAQLRLMQLLCRENVNSIDLVILVRLIHVLVLDSVEIAEGDGH